MKMTKLAAIFLVSLIGLLGLASMAVAVDFTEVEVNGVDVTDGGTVYVERGDSVEIRVELESTTPESDMRVKAWLGGYEYSDIEDVTGFFDLVDGVTYSKFLNLELPDDMDASEDYVLHIEVYDDDTRFETNNINLQVERRRHNLRIQDVILRPGSSVEAGNLLRTVVRVENMGDKKEEDLKVTVKVPELGVSARDYIDELAAVENEDEETSRSSGELLLRIPADAPTGDYTVEVEVEYNRGHDLVSRKEMLHVKGVEREAPVEAIVSIDTTAQRLSQGGEAAYKLMFANLGKARAVYSAEVLGTELWATARVSPSFVAVGPGDVGEMFVHLKAKEDAAEGAHTFTLRVNAGAAMAKEVTLSADVAAKKEASKWEALKSTLEIGFAVLVVLLIILGLVVAFKKIGGNNESGPETVTEQTYY